MDKSIHDIINENGDLHKIQLKKPSKDRSTWTLSVNDESSNLNGVSDDSIDNYDFRTTTLVRNGHYFTAYKIKKTEDDFFEYYVDPRKCVHRKDSEKFINGILDYRVNSNDISKFKNDPSFKYTQSMMWHDGVSNYMDLCVHFGEYSSIGTGLTRMVRNVIVLDIDVDCTKPENKKEVENIILMCSKVNWTPDFYIINHESKHIQLQWLTKDCKYKCINKNLLNKKILELNSKINVNREINIFETDFTELTQDGIEYRKFTRALTYLSKKYKFGDKNYTFWKAKNFYTAFLGLYDLELKMPYVINDEIKYLTHEEMDKLFNTKEYRDQYFSMAPTMSEIYEKTKNIISKHIENISEEKIIKIKDDEDIKPKTKKPKIYGESRNSFVFECTRETTWEIARENNFKDSSNFKKLSDKSFKQFKNKVKRIVREKFEIENDKYGGIWPGTTNMTKYSTSEFNNTFINSFNFAIEKYQNTTWSDDDRKKSIQERSLKKKLHLMLVDYLKSMNNVKNKELLEIVNNELIFSNQTPISNTTLKRCLSELNTYTKKQKYELYKEVISSIELRIKDLSSTDEHNKKQINVCKKRLKRLSLNNMDNIKNYINTMLGK